MLHLLLVPKEFVKQDVHKATLCWVPMDEKKKGRPEESKSTTTAHDQSGRF